MKRCSLLWFCIPSLMLVLNSCDNETEMVQMEHNGYVQGTTFLIKYLTKEGEDYSEEIGKIFRSMDASVSTYVDSSLISAVNRGDTVVMDSIFSEVLDRSLDLARETDGLFDPTVEPLFQYWGFGESEVGAIDSAGVDSLMNFVGYKNIWTEGNRVALPLGYRLNFNAIAQGQTVDLQAEMLESKNITDYMVEVGGEVRARGKNINGEIWKLGIDKPSEEMDFENRLQAIVHLKDAALATSGSYRQFREDSATGMKYSHTFDPRTGYPVRSNLLSVSIIADNAMDADAYATVCMAKNLNEAKSFLRSHQDLHAYIIYSNEAGEWEIFQTKGFGAYLQGE